MDFGKFSLHILYNVEINEMGKGVKLFLEGVR